MNLETIQSMWEKDSQIDKDNLHDESLKIPALHAKYHELFNNILLLRKKQSSNVKIFAMKDMNTILAKLIQMCI